MSDLREVLRAVRDGRLSITDAAKKIEQPHQEPVFRANEELTDAVSEKLRSGQGDNYIDAHYPVNLYTHPSRVRRPSFEAVRKILNLYMMEHETPAAWLLDLLDDYADACNIPKAGEG